MMKTSPNKHTIKMDVKTSIGLLLHADTSQVPEHIRNCQERTIQVPKDAVQKELEILSWRFKTFLPIVKPVDYEINQNSNSLCRFPQARYQLPQHQKVIQSPKKFLGGNQKRESFGNPFEKEECEILVKMEEVRCRLSDLDLLPFSQIIYLLKEMMIGYDALIDIFGIFGPTENMVAVSCNQWKVWINQDFFSNKKNDRNQATGERDFIYRLLMISQKHCQATNISKIFFNELKEFTYSNECGFISMIDKIKDFTKVHKIFHVNKVTLPQDKREKDKPYNPEISYLNTNININESIDQRKKPSSKLGLQKKLSFQPNVTVQQLNNQRINKNHFKGVNKTGNNVSQIVDRPLTLQHVQSQKNINHSSFFYYPPYNPLSSASSPVPSTLKTFQDISESWKDNNRLLNVPQNFQRPIKSSYLQKGQLNDLKPYHSPDIVEKKMSPSKNLNKNSSFANISKSRHELKLLVNKEKEEIHHPYHNLHPEPQKQKKNQRKYSEQLFKPKSVDALAGGMKKICGSNIYQQDPEIRTKGVNVIKKKNPINSIESPTKGYHDKSQTFKGPDSTTPNHSSNSTNQMHHSDEYQKKGSSYQYLKQNDLNNNKMRNNQSSYYGVGGYPQQQKRDVKNMTISYQFKNRNQNQSKSSASSQNQHHQNGNNWNKKLSGLFSDDASIKHLKGSVKFKTAEEERFEKEYLKDVKLQMLEKFGRPVRHSIVDQEDDFRPCSKNPYKSMQLIEEVIDEGKSYMQKEEQIHEQVEMLEVRGRNKTMQARKPSNEEKINKQVQQRVCYSFQCSQGSDSSGGFNFESELYVLNKR